MYWIVRLFWLGVFLFSVNIAFQIYYANTPYSKVEHFKSEMEIVDSQHKIQDKVRQAKTKIAQYLGLYNTVMQYITNILEFVGIRIT
jgi:hypothetical protein